MSRRLTKRLLICLLLVYISGALYFYTSADTGSRASAHIDHLHHPVIKEFKLHDMEQKSESSGNKDNVKRIRNVGTYLKPNRFQGIQIAKKDSKMKNAEDENNEKFSLIKGNTSFIRRSYQDKKPDNADNYINIFRGRVMSSRNSIIEIDRKPVGFLKENAKHTPVVVQSTLNPSRRRRRSLNTMIDIDTFTPPVTSNNFMKTHLDARSRGNIRSNSKGDRIFERKRKITMQVIGNNQRNYPMYDKQRSSISVDRPNQKRIVDLYRDKETLIKHIKSIIEDKNGKNQLLKNFIEKLEETDFSNMKRGHGFRKQQSERKSERSKYGQVNHVSALPSISEVFDLRTHSMDQDKVLPLYQLNFVNMSDDLMVYSMFLDERKPDRFMRIVLVGKSGYRVKNKKLLCQFKILDGINKSKFSKVSYYETCESHMLQFSAYIGSCKIPDEEVNLQEVILSLDDNGKHVLAYLNVINNDIIEPRKDTFAVCVPPLFGNVSLIHLTEFIEFSRMLGADHFIFYSENIAENVKELLKHYEHLRIVTLLPWKLPIPESDIWYHGQSASVWDCLYRTMFKFKHVLFVDFDEFLMPQHHFYWTDLLTHVQTANNLDDNIISAYRFSSAFFDPNAAEDGVPLSYLSKQLITIRSTRRTRYFSNIRTKMLVDPVKIFELGIHHVSKPNEEEFEVYNVGTEDAILNHYRVCTVDYSMDCKNKQTDNTAWKFKSKLLQNVKKRFIEFDRFQNAARYSYVVGG